MKFIALKYGKTQQQWNARLHYILDKSIGF
jgi:hypothetical protein